MINFLIKYIYLTKYFGKIKFLIHQYKYLTNIKILIYKCYRSYK